MWDKWQIIYEDAWTAEFNSIVRKRIPYSSDSASETMDEVRQELAIKLNELDNAPNSINAYLRAAFRNTLEDYLRKKEGYPRPPEWIRRLGAAYERIYKLLCLENRAVNDIHAIMHSLFQYTRDFVEQIVTEVRAGVINCGSWRDTVSIDHAMAEVEAAGRHTPANETPEDILQDMDSSALFSTFLGQGHGNPVRSETFKEIIKALEQNPLEDNERLLLRLVYADGQSISEAARATNIKDSEARKTLKNIYKRLKATLLAVGITEI